MNKEDILDLFYRTRFYNDANGAAVAQVNHPPPQSDEWGGQNTGSFARDDERALEDYYKNEHNNLLFREISQFVGNRINGGGGVTYFPMDTNVSEAVQAIANAATAPVPQSAYEAEQTMPENVPTPNVSGLMPGTKGITNPIIVAGQAVTQPTPSVTEQPQPAQEPAPTQPAPQEPKPTPLGNFIDYINAAVLNGEKEKAAKAEEQRRSELQAAVDAQIARENQLQEWYGQDAETDARYMNAPYFRTAQQREIAAQLTQLKWMHDNAESVAKAQGLRPDQVQQQVSEQASLLREQAAAAGITGLEGYGPGVTLRDTLRYLQSNDERARADGLNRYADSSADVYDDAYMKYRLQGENMRNAAALAERDARKYQKERLNFQRDMFHTYGLEGGYANDWATQILAQMAEENPALANYYASQHGTPKELLGRQQELENKEIEEASKQGAEWRKFILNEKGAGSALLRKIIELSVAGGINYDNASRLAAQGLSNSKELKRYESHIKLAEENAAYNRRVGRLGAARQAGLITDEEYNLGLKGVLGIKDFNTKGTDMGKETRSGIKTLIDIATKNMELVQKQIEGLPRDMDGRLTPEAQKQYEDLSRHYAELGKDRDEYTKLYEGTIFGTPGGADVPEPYDSNDMDKNVRTVAQMIEVIRNNDSLTKNAETNLDKMIDNWLADSHIQMSLEDKRTLKERARAWRRNEKARTH